ncbi:MAG: UDP-N-acetylglucosamine 1-carboxyvinyltransferase [Alphaproteobacteria bacterium]|jgi:UDP-N-acetylglucosamine 1-carboxyvinyltransferase|nr:UDP-N-acetylglucosamine 1-carboxyvinyltransferase [Alphaproteobacteria bacterium]
MDKIEVIGNGPLKGKINISGAKNSALKIMAASILTDDILHLTNMPYLADITSMCRLLNDMGVKISLDGGAGPKGNTGRAMAFHAKELKQLKARYEIVKTFRASIVVLGPLLVRFGEAEVSLPGGCAIGARPVDLHLKGMEALGATIAIENGYVKAKAPEGGLVGGNIKFPVVSVGATENTLMAATLAKGTTVLENCAIEPEINDIIDCLIKMGAKISGKGTRTLTIEGVEKLNGCTHDIIADRIEAGTYGIAALITDGEIEIIGAKRQDLESFIEIIEKTGAEVIDTEKGLIFKRKDNTELQCVDFTTEPHPGLPTDLQAQLMALMTIAKGSANICETIWENRFMHVPELNRMGANIEISHNNAIVHGVKNLIGCPVMATDLRASASLILAGLVAKGTTIVDRVYHLDRGYEQIEEKLSSVGAKIRRIK